MHKSILYISTLLLVLSACVTPKIHNTLVAEHESAKSALISAEKKVFLINGKLEKSEDTIVLLRTQISDLRNDSLYNGQALTNLKFKYAQLSDTYDLLVSKNTSYMADKAKETKKLFP